MPELNERPSYLASQLTKINYQVYSGHSSSCPHVRRTFYNASAPGNLVNMSIMCNNCNMHLRSKFKNLNVLKIHLCH